MESLNRHKESAAFGAVNLRALRFCGQVALTALMLAMAWWVRLPVGAMFGLLLAGAIAALAGCRPSKSAAMIARWGWVLVWIAALVLLGSFWRAREEFDLVNSWDPYYAVLAGLAGIVFFGTAVRVEPELQLPWRVLTLVWLLIAAGVWLGASYVKNQAWEFYCALLLIAALLFQFGRWLQVRGPLRMVLNTLILLLVALPAPDWFRPSDTQLLRDPKVRYRYYSYAGAKRDPTDFGRWWDFYLSQWGQTEKAITSLDPEGYLPFRLRPNSTSTLMQCPISINSRGFRGREIPPDKGDAYRIVTLGESTTFGITLGKDDRPWPELLEELIRRRVRSTRPVEVINAGVFGYTLDDNIHRFTKEIAPLEPDLVISYHGINGFPTLYDALPSRPRNRPPPYTERPVRLLADCEFRLKMMLFRRHKSQLVSHPPKISNPLETGYARAYERLVELAHRSGCRLALANFSMAVNDRSDPDVVRFYQVGYPAARWLIKANALHSEIVGEIARRHPDICFIDTHPGLDGHFDDFLDLVHFDPVGERQMAETILAGITPLLEHDLAPSSALTKLKVP